MLLLSIFAFLCPPTWSHDENVDRPHLYHVIMGSCTLIVGVLKYFLIFRVLSALIFILCGFRPMVLLSIFAFLCPPTWSHDENVDCPHLYHVIMGSYTLIVGVLKYFLILWGFVRLDFIIWGFRPIVLLSIFAFLCPNTWSHDENVDCPHLYHVIMGSCTLIVGVLKYFLIFGGFVRFDFYPLGLSSILAFLCPPTWSHDENVDRPHLYHVIMGLWTLIVGVLKSFLIFGGFVRFDFYPLGFRLWCFCPFLLFSVRPRDRMTRMFIVHTCIMWSWDRAPWFLEY